MFFIIFLLSCCFQLGISTFPYYDLFRNVDNKTSSQCSAHLLRLARGIVSGELWALKMVDAASKIPSSILNGNFQPLGNYDECLQVHHNQIDGKFCRLAIATEQPDDNPDSLVQAIGVGFYICIPNSCNADALNSLLPPLLRMNDSACWNNDPKELNTAAMIAITIFSAVGIATILSTLYDFYICWSNKEPTSRIALAFSLYSNGKKLSTFHRNSAQIGCLNGIKLFSMMWVVLGHVYMGYAFAPLDNYLDVLQWIESASSQYILGATVSVDSFLLVAGFVVVYNFQYVLDKGNKFNLLSFYLHRYFRLTPALAAMVLAHATLFDYLGSGPVYSDHTSTYLSETCKNNWWSALLYVQNYVNPKALCIPQSWYLSLDLQLFLLSPIFMFALRLRPFFGHCLIFVVSFLSIAASFLVGWFYNLNGQISGNQETLGDFLSFYYPVVHTRMAPYLIGILLGYWVYKMKKEEKKLDLGDSTEIVFWLGSIAVLLTCVYSGHDLQVTKMPNKIANSVFLALMRPSWALALSWIILACTMNRGGIVNKILSCPIVQILSRLCYSVYLLHYAFIFLTNFATRSALHFTPYLAFHKFWGDLIFILVIATLWTLVFESPVIVLENMFYKKTRSRNKNLSNNNNV